MDHVYRTGLTHQEDRIGDKLERRMWNDLIQLPVALRVLNKWRDIPTRATIKSFVGTDL